MRQALKKKIAHPRIVVERLDKRLSRKLDLNPTQAEQVQRILDRSRGQRQELRHE